ncbi:MAG: hypothetical protein F6K04_26610 [Leptolyngbya sp. SIO4C5]|nr:hypothetical protein [Leptolyngbya sp. SIO4C5]
MYAEPLERIQEDTERDFFMSAHDAQAYGLIDQVIEQKELSSSSNVAALK